ncbi:MAG: pantetheine-phosphate adenylyltransferase [Haloarculaceae archaeon]
MRVVVAGTFGPIHDGHRRLLATALECGDEGVVVGLTSDAFARGKRDRPVPGFAERRARLLEELAALDEWDRTVTVRRIDGEFDFAATDPTLDAVAVSTESDDEYPALNERRRAGGLAPLVAVVVPVVRGADGERISSTRVVRGEVDEHGRPADATDG